MPDENKKKPWETAEGFDKNIGAKQNSDTRYNNTTYVEQVDETTGEKTWAEAQTEKPLKNTGQGIEAALGTNYSWEQQGTDKAVSQYGSDVLSVKQNAQENAATINQNLSQYQEQADMMQYQNNQQAEKVGWTGGYVLDQNRQMDYLKASLNAQMYGAIKLQEYGYDTSLAAARLSYDLNQKAYAQEYYTQAVTNALNEAQITGTYFSAETKDMMSQLAIATQIANDSSQSDADKENATKLKESIYAWFNTNGISTQGVDTLQAWQADQQNELNWQSEIWTEYNAALQSAKASVDENASMFIMYGNDGQIVYQNGEVKTIDMSGLTPADLKSYAKVTTKSKEQVQSYIDSLFTEAIALATKVTKDKDGNQTSEVDYTNKDYRTAVTNMLNIINEINKGEKDILVDVPSKYKDLYPNYSQPQGGSNNQEGQDGQEGSSSEGSENSGSSEGFKSPFTDNNAAKWTQTSSYTVGDKEIGMNTLKYLSWNDSKNLLEDNYKDNINKVSFTLNSKDMPEGWLSTFQKALSTKDTSFMIETLPTIATNPTSSRGVVTIQGLKNQQQLSVGTLSGNTIISTGLGGQIEYFLKDFYENTTGKQIQPGSMIAVGDTLLFWNGEDGKAIQGISTTTNNRWVVMNKNILNQNKTVYTDLLDL